MVAAGLTGLICDIVSDPESPVTRRTQGSPHAKVLKGDPVNPVNPVVVKGRPAEASLTTGITCFGVWWLLSPVSPPLRTNMVQCHQPPPLRFPHLELFSF